MTSKTSYGKLDLDPVHYTALQEQQASHEDDDSPRFSSFFMSG